VRNTTRAPDHRTRIPVSRCPADRGQATELGCRRWPRPARRSTRPAKSPSDRSGFGGPCSCTGRTTDLRPATRTARWPCHTPARPPAGHRRRIGTAGCSG